MSAAKPVHWREWDEEVFEEAQRSRKPVFLFLGASWCRFSRRLRDEVLAREEIAALLAEQFLCVAVDRDRHPEVDRRYNEGGWPTVCVLTPEGEVLAGEVAPDADRLHELLQLSARRFRERPEGRPESVRRAVRRDLARRPASAGGLSDEIVEKVENAIVEAFDPEFGGFGRGQKFPHWEAIDFALLRYVETGREELRRVAEVTLAKMSEAPIHDAVEGGFFRFSASRDWRKPHTEKLLETNAGLLRNYLEAAQIFGRKDFEKVARKTVEFLVARMRHPEHPAFVGSIEEDETYYELSAAERAARAEEDRPRADTTIYVNWNAAAVSALFKGAAVLDEPDYAALALETLEFLLEQAYDRGRGMYHFLDGGRHLLGLLSDQAYTARALLHAAQYTGDNRFLDVCEDLLNLVMERQRSSGGAFDDYRAESSRNIRLRRGNQSILENGLMAEVLLRAHHLTGRQEYLETARRALEAFVDEYHYYGYATAGYARAVELYLHPPVHVVIVGRRDHSATAAMVRAATEFYLPSKLVQVIDPQQDREMLRVFELPAESEPCAYVNVRTAHVARAASVEELLAAMRRMREGGEGRRE